jgi:hypothetical protein
MVRPTLVGTGETAPLPTTRDARIQYRQLDFCSRVTGA